MNNTWSWKQTARTIEATTSGFLFILGPSGVGKTYAVATIAQSLNIDVFWIDSQKCSSSRELKTLLDSQFATNLVQNIAHTSNRRAVIIDELDTLYNIDRTIVSSLSAYTSTASAMPIICIGNIALDKKIRVTFENATFVLYSAPSETDICIFLRSQYPCIGYDKIVEAAENCYGNLTTAIQCITFGKEDKKDTSSTFDYIFTCNAQRDGIAHVMREDPWLMPLRYHENLPKELVHRKGAAATKQKFYQQTLETLCNWDIMMQNIPNQEIPIDYMVQGVMELHTLSYKNRTSCTHDFTKLFSHLSLQRKHEKSLYTNGEEGFPWYHAQIFCDYIKHK
jgi:hypothetical protein